ncbi:MAG: RraA family protein [Acidobacteria bacterium]|nr:RraA family protein [Acidobacteriota bacterium]
MFTQSVLLLFPFALQLSAQPAGERSILTVKLYSAEDDAQVLKLFEGLRVADVSDGMDIVGLPDSGLMNPAIRPLWRDTEKFDHQFTGIAVTVRYVPTNRPKARLAPEEFSRWESNWYREISPEPFTRMLREGAALVIDGGEDGDTGSIGSNNILSWRLRGMRGVVTSGGARDTDEIIKERVPLYYRRPGRGIRPGRNEVESVNRPIMCGGVLVRPADVVVADGDGVIVVPREQAAAVASAARKILESDKAGRRKLYEKLGLPADKTVR